MARRKRLTPANPDVFAGELNGSFQASRYEPARYEPVSASRAPIAGVASDASTAAALEEMSNTLADARSQGHMIMQIALGQIDMNHLVRDRIALDDQEMATLVASLRARGQQTPVEVVDLGGERYGLISGWRRCQAIATLQAQGEGDGTVLALLRRPESASDAYVAMVEENEIRVGLSYFERARIVVRAIEQGVFETEKAALMGLFGTASRAKRSKIKTFQRLVHALDGVLKYPAQIGERFGMQLAYRLEQEEGLAATLSEALKQGDPADAAAEQKILADALSLKKPKARPDKSGHYDRALGQGVAARVYSDGRLELRGTALPASLRDELIRWLETKLAKTPGAS